MHTGSALRMENILVMKDAANEPIAYEQRLILFLDFLGFKRIVENTTTDAKRLASLLRAIKLLSELRADEADISKQVTQFSDSVVVSYSVSETSSVFYLVNEVALLIIDLAYMGFLVRGGITFGSLIHTTEYLVGPAMIRAYEMESMEAKSPRVLLDPNIIKIARRYHAPQNSPKDEAQYVSGFMTRDEDGLFFFDYVGWHSVVAVAGADANMYDTYLKTLGSLVEEGLSNADPHIREKYLWLHKRYVASIEEILNEREDSNWYAENTHVVEVARALPRYDDLAKEAPRSDAIKAGGSDDI